MLFEGGGEGEKKTWKKNRKSKSFLFEFLFLESIITRSFLHVFLGFKITLTIKGVVRFVVFYEYRIFYHNKINAKKRYKMLKKGIKMLYLLFVSQPWYEQLILYFK